MVGAGIVFGQDDAAVKDREAAASIRGRVLGSSIFESTMNDTTDANLFEHDGWIYSSDGIARKDIKQGFRREGVALTSDDGATKEFLRFEKKTDAILFYKAAKTLAMRPRDDWQGTVSFWLRLDPAALPPGYVDPFLVTQRAWNDGAFFVDFDKVTPRTFRFGAFSDLDHWNPDGVEWDKIPEKDRPMITVKNPPFAKDRWTHVCFTFKGVNATNDEMGAAALYLNGKRRGTLQRKFKITWKEPSPTVPVSAAMLGIGYIGDFDHLMYFNRALGPKEIKWLHSQGPAGHSSDFK